MASPEQVRPNKVVQFTYNITNPKGDVVEQVDLPLYMVFMRHNRLYDTVERAMLGCHEGEVVSADVSAQEGAWGEPDPSLMFTEALDNVPPPYRRVGQEAQLQNESGEVKTFTVTKVTADEVSFDSNHPFAGQTMTFHVKVLSIRDASQAELLHGIESGAPGTTTMDGRIH